MLGWAIICAILAVIAGVFGMLVLAGGVLAKALPFVCRAFLERFSLALHTFPVIREGQRVPGIGTPPPVLRALGGSIDPKHPERRQHRRQSAREPLSWSQ